jgi:AbrB family looped-hinge helix DNA binding protein
MPRATLTTKGQITIPKVVRERLNVDAGDGVLFRELSDGTIVIEAETADLMSLGGSLKSRVKGVSVEDMNDAAVQGALSRYKRSRKK